MTDQQLLRDYSLARSEPAFAEFVRRHVDFVYSAALRMVYDAHLAEDVTQGVFVAVAQNSRRLADHPVLPGWLHRTTQNLAANTVRSEVRHRAREQEAAAMNELCATESEALWEHIAPDLDAALGDLSEGDRDALLLRYFQRKSAREIAQALGVSEEAAQKRVTRAIERLREVFAKRGVSVGASGFIIAISANAVQAAPAGLAVSISTAALLTGTTITAAATATKTMAITTLQKTVIAAVVIATAGAGIHEARQVSTLQNEVRSFHQQQAPLETQVAQLHQERDEAVTKLGAAQQENEQLRQSFAELPRLRGEVARLRATRSPPAASRITDVDPNDPAVQHFLAAKAVANQIAHYLELMPDKKIPELKLLTDEDWLSVVKAAKFDTEADIRKTLGQLRSRAKERMFMGSALSSFTHATNGQLPTDISQLKPWFKSALNDHGATLDDTTLQAIFERYTLLHTGNMSDLPPDAWIVAEKAAVDKDYDSRAKFGLGRSTVISTGIGEAGDPDDKSY
jgi:RNA polymerase sigma factor (sigma-70 family)